MALSANTVWEVRAATGSDSNGGGFIAGSGGTDYSQQDAAQATGTASSSGTTVTATTGIFTAAMVGNLITNGTTWFQITAFTSSTVVTVDAAPSWTSQSVKVGGALATLTPAAANAVFSNKIFLKGTITTTAGYTFTQSNNPSDSAPQCQLIGYGTARGDGVKAVIKLATNSSLTALTVAGGWLVMNVTADCSSLSNSTGFNVTSACTSFVNCKALNYGNQGFNLNAGLVTLLGCEATGGTSSSGLGVYAAGQQYNFVDGCNVHDNAGGGIFFNSATNTVTNCLVANNAATAYPGIYISYNSRVKGNTVTGNGFDGITCASANFLISTVVRNNLICFNGGYGLNADPSAGSAAGPLYDGNAYYSNTSGGRHNCDDTSANPVNGINPYTNVNDITLTADPFVSKATGDYRLNTAAGGGAACRGHGVPAAWPGNSLTVSAPDMGAAQHADAGGAAVFNPIGCGFIKGA